MKQIVVDSSVLIEFLRREDKEKTLLYQLVEKDCELKLPMIVCAEMYSGKSVWENKAVSQLIKEWLRGMDLMVMSLKICKGAGEIRAKYGIDLIDAVIAATAKINKLPLVTLNKKHFSMIKGLKLYL